MKFDTSWSADIKAKLSSDTKDEYKIECYSGGTACCSAQDWKECASGRNKSSA